MSDVEKRESSKHYKLYCAIFLVLATVLTLYFWFEKLGQMYMSASPVTRSPMIVNTCIEMLDVPDGFRYDVSDSSLSYIGVIDKQTKESIVKSARGCGGIDVPSQDMTAFRCAIDSMSFSSLEKFKELPMITLWLGALSGLLGVLVRSIINFIGWACYKKNADIETWWPYYALRPLVGFVLGAIIIVMLDSKILSIPSDHGVNALWWVAISFLAGFGADDFAYRLRSITKTVFGESDKSTSEHTSGNKAGG